jgi:hypothetical protein
MTTALWILAAWLTLQVPAGIVIGTLLKGRSE